MDPDTLLSELLDAARALADSDGTDAELDELGVRIARDLLDLDAWIMRGGFLPSRWSAR